jgi:hypothetical protein
VINDVVEDVVEDVLVKEISKPNRIQFSSTNHHLLIASCITNTTMYPRQHVFFCGSSASNTTYLNTLWHRYSRECSSRDCSHLRRVKDSVVRR